MVSGEQRIEEASKGRWEGKLLSHRASPEGYDDSSNRTERGKRENAYRGEKWEDSRDVSDTEGLWTTRMSLGMDAGWNEARRVTPPVFRSSPWKVLTLGDALGPQWLPWPQADTLQGTFLLLRLGDQVMWTISVEKIRLGVQRR